MLTKRIISVLNLNNGVLFRTRNFFPDYRYTLNFVDLWDIDEIVLLDITRAGQGDRENFLNAVRSLSKNCFVPLTAGGGVKTIEDFGLLLANGADKVAINTQAVIDPNFITQCAQRFGKQAVTISIDVKKEDQKYIIHTSCGQNKTNLELTTWVKECESRGAGEILINSIDKDGTLEGYDNELNQLLTSHLKIPVICCGGAGNWQHFSDAFSIGEVSGVCTSNVYHFTQASIKSAKSFLAARNILIR